MVYFANVGLCLQTATGNNSQRIPSLCIISSDQEEDERPPTLNCVLRENKVSFRKRRGMIDFRSVCSDAHRSNINYRLGKIRQGSELVSLSLVHG